MNKNKQRVPGTKIGMDVPIIGDGNIPEAVQKLIIAMFQEYVLPEFTKFNVVLEALAGRMEKLENDRRFQLSLDEDVSDCRKLVLQKHTCHPQLFAGPWKTSKIAQDYRVVNVPTTIILDPAGRVVQMDLFNATLKNFIQELLKSD